ncbi:MAG TPA: hypothetical protein VGO73_05930 [Pyrinomonadaceae bacterium]|jgi:hypothetical protein|nr:hypothetical protein [Pyrinomonadaceae bacterium]
MIEQHPIENLIEDLKKIEALLPISGYMHPVQKEAPDFAILYLTANSGLIEYCLDAVYKHRTKVQRLEMSKSHPELHESVVHNDSYKLASHALSSARSCWNALQDPGVYQDDIHMLVRALRYAKYCVDLDLIRRVFMHPVDRYLS